MSTDVGALESARRFHLIHLGIPLAAGALLLGLVELTGFDRWLQDLFFDPLALEFPLRQNGFLELVMHHWAKYTVVLVGAGALGAFILSFWLPQLQPRRRELLFLVLAMGLSTGTVSFLKHSTNKHCPWDLEIYGGYAPYDSLFSPTPGGIDPGRCFPAGHSSAGFSLMAFYFPLRRRDPRLARRLLLGGAACGLVLGSVRMIQGAHFLSHTLWAGLVCWAVMVALYELLLRRQPSPAPGPALAGQ